MPDQLTEAVPKVGNNPLSDSYLKAVAKELEQTAVAVSVMGTAPWKLKQMAALADPVPDALEGERPEVAKLRSALKRLVHNVKTSSVKAAPAAAALRALAGGIVDARKVVAKGLGGAEQFIRASGFEVVNTWGYTKSEVRDATTALENAVRALNKVGLPTAAGGVAELNPDKVKGSVFVQYDHNVDVFVFDLSRSDSNNTENVLRAIGERLWRQEFGQGDKETWGNGSGLRAFSEAFAARLKGRSMNSDTLARLQMTVGKLASRWPEGKQLKEHRESPFDMLIQEIKYEIGTVTIRRRGNVFSKWQKVKQPDEWKKKKGTFGYHTPEEQAQIEAKKRQDMEQSIHRIAKLVEVGKLKDGMSVQDHIKLAEKSLKHHLDRLPGLLKTLKAITGQEAIGRAKELGSALGKLSKTNPDGTAKYQTVDAMPDLTGTRIVVDSIEGIYGVVDSLKENAKKHGISIVKVDDKVQKPQGSERYRSIHVDIRDTDGNVKELQIRTKRQNIVADWSHDQYKPFTEAQVRALQKHRSKISEYASKVSDHFFREDSGEDPGEPPKCPRVVSLYFGCLT